MSQKLIFIYDGECPFCNHFAELVSLKGNLPNLQIKNARDNPSEIPDGYDMDIKGAILYKDGQLLSGASAINWICSQIKEPSGSLLKILSITFSSNKRTDFIFPFLLISRRIALFFLGVPRKLFS